MPTPSLTLARRLYARKHKLSVKGVGADMYVEASGAWLAIARCRWPGTTSYRAVGATESAALRKLCRALGWKP